MTTPRLEHISSRSASITVTVYWARPSGSVHMTVFGRLVEEAWRSLADRYSYVELDECIVMPNHFHGSVTIGQPDAANSTGRVGKSLGSLVAVFKTASTNQINRSRGT